MKKCKMHCVDTVVQYNHPALIHRHVGIYTHKSSFHQKTTSLKVPSLQPACVCVCVCGDSRFRSDVSVSVSDLMSDTQVRRNS